MTDSDPRSAAAAALRTHYGLEGALTALDGEYDRNWRVDLADGTGAVLKVMRPDCPAPWVDLQCAALAHLALRAPDVPLPRVLRAASGQPWCRTAQGRLAWLVTWRPGTLVCEAGPRDMRLLEALGETAARLAQGLDGFDHEALARTLPWHLTRAGEHLDACTAIAAPWRAPAEAALQRFVSEVAPRLADLPAGAVHGDLNDHNLLVLRDDQGLVVSGVLDLGDMGRQPLVCDLAIAAAYAAFGAGDALTAIAAVVRGYHRVRALSDAEIDVLGPLIGARLAVSLATSSQRAARDPDDDYAVISQAPARTLLAQLDALPAGLMRIALAQACDGTGVAHAAAVSHTLATARPVPPIECGGEAAHVLDLGAGSLLLGADPASGRRPHLDARIDADMARAGVRVALGRWHEPRLLYDEPAFGAGGDPLGERRTVHLGIDVFCAAGTDVRAPLDAVVHQTANNARPLDYGPLVILRHEAGGGATFYTLYGHLDMASIAGLSAGQTLSQGQPFAKVGAPPENGDWPPHLHLQIVLDDLGLGADFPGVSAPSQAALWCALSPNPAVLLGVPDARVDGTPDPAALAARRRRVLSGALSLSYREPLHIVRGFGPRLYDSHARAYLDVYNNVAHVGHAHPHVLDAVTRQLALLNTNTRYLHETILDYAERLTARLPAPLEVAFFVNSASEANELALRLARTATGRRDMLVVDGAYHGHTSALIDMSPYKFDGPGGAGRAEWVHGVPAPDDYRGPYRRDDPEAGKKYAAAAGAVIDALPPEHALAGFIAESLPSVGGQLVPPPGWLAGIYARVRAHGGLCIADEVQTGFGRLGKRFWGFEMQDVVPDVVVLGKPIGNGFPLAAVVTTREIAAAFDNGMEFFATFGGNPVACAAGRAVLEVLDREALPANAARLGAVLLDGLRALQGRHALIGDVRGVGFFAGVELVADRDTRSPAEHATRYAVERLRARRVLAGVDGPLHNVIKLRPTLVTGDDDIATLLAALDGALADTARHLAVARA